MFNDESFPVVEAAKRRPTPRFLVNTFDLVNDPKHSNQVVTWTREGLSFVILDVKRFCKEMLPIYFKHTKFESFVRQLNMYGFAKAGEPSWKEFSHPDFRRGHPELLDNIVRQRRPKGVKKVAAPAERATERIAAVRAVAAPLPLPSSAPSSVPQAAFQRAATDAKSWSSSASSSSEYDDEEESEYMPKHGVKRGRDAGAIVPVPETANGDAALILAELRRSKAAVEDVKRWAADAFRAMSERVRAAEQRAESAEKLAQEAHARLGSPSTAAAGASPSSPSSTFAAFGQPMAWREQAARQDQLTALSVTPAAMRQTQETLSFDLADTLLAPEPSAKRARVLDALSVLDADISLASPKFDLHVAVPPTDNQVEYSVSEMGAFDAHHDPTPVTSQHGAPRMA